MPNNELHVVFGASGGIGNALAKELIAQGKHVRAITHRGHADLPAGVETCQGDLLDLASAQAACRDAAVVYHCVNVPYPEWEQKLMPMMENLIQAAAGAKVVYVDNLYGYGKVDHPMTEDTPYHPAGHKGALRVRLANALMDAHRQGTVRAVIGRGSDFYGPNANAVAGNFAMRQLVSGKRAMWLGNLDMPHTLSFLPDFARGMALLAERDAALGQVWHIPAAEAITGRQYLEMAFAEAGMKAKIGVYGRTMMTLLGLFDPFLREVAQMLYQFENPFIVDASKFTRAFETFRPTPHREAVKESVAWYRLHPSA